MDELAAPKLELQVLALLLVPEWKAAHWLAQLEQRALVLLAARSLMAER